MLKHKFSVITATRNRARLLGNVYDCLAAQTEQDFEWIVVDDCSTDNTNEVMKNFISRNYLDIKFTSTSTNRGKPEAINIGVNAADSYISVTLDDDDLFLPNVLEIAWGYFDARKECFTGDTVSVSGLSMDKQNMIIGDIFPKHGFVSNHIECRHNKHIGGDKCEFFLTKVLKEFPFPILDKEKVLTEDVVWNRIALKYNTYYVNQIFLIKEYRPDGITAHFKTLQMQNPLGWELYNNESSTSKFFFLWQIKRSASYIRFAKINKRKNIFINARNKLVYPFGYIAYIIAKILKKF